MDEVFAFLLYSVSTRDMERNKSSCGLLDLPQILFPFGATTGSFPCKYLGLPLSVTKPKRVDEQLLVDRIAGKQSPWRGKQMTKVARLVLTNSVLTAIATYFLTSLTLSS